MIATTRRLGRLALVTAATCGLAWSTPTAFAGPIADKATEAESLLSQPGDLAAFDAASASFAAATEAFEAAADTAWAELPFQLRSAAFAESVAGFGDFTPRPNSTFHRGDTLKVYLEPVGYGFAQDASGYRIRLTAGMEIRRGDVILGKAEDFGALEWSGPNKSRTFHGEVSVTAPELKPGDYQLLLTLNDAAAGKVTSATLPFSIVE
jgi:hypothetical protein